MRRTRTPSEDAIHEGVAEALTLAIAVPGRCSTDGAMWWSTEHRNAASAVEGGKRKARGVVAGQFDLSVLFAGRLHGIELKAARGRISDAQGDFRDAAHGAGAQVAVCRSLEDVLAALTHWGVPHRRFT